MKLLDIQRQEIGGVLLCGLMLALRAAGKVMGWAAVQAILLKRLGLASIPYSFIIFAIGGMLGSCVYVCFADAIRRTTMLTAYCLATGSAFIVSFVLIPQAKTDITSLIAFAVFFLIAYSFGYATIGLQIWTIINDSFTPSQGVRLYPLISVAPLLGGIAGGTLLQLLPRGFPSEYLIALWGLAILGVIPLLRLFQKHYGSRTLPPVPVNAGETSIKKYWHNLRQGYFLLHSPLVSAIAGICILFWAVASLKEYHYLAIVKATLGSEENISQYYGYYTILLNSAVIILQLGFTGRFIKIVGVGFGLCALPLTIIAGLGLLALFYAFLAAFVMRFTWDIVAMTVQGSCYQLSFNAVLAPYRGRIRGFLEGIINPLGGILGGVILISLNSGVITPDKARLSVIFLALFFAGVWLFAAMAARRHYYRAVIANLASNDPRTYRDALEILREERGLALRRRQLKGQDSMVLKKERLPFAVVTMPEFSLIEVPDKKFSKNLWQGTASVTIERQKLELQIFRERRLWRFYHHHDHILLVGDEQPPREFPVYFPGGLYWKLEMGYLALFWNSDGIDTLEIGDYLQGEVITIRNHDRRFRACRILQSNGKPADPFIRFVLEIDPLGYAVI